MQARPRSNSFNLTEVLDVARRPGAPCPVREARRPIPRVSSVWLRLPDRMRLFRTRTRDFAAEELIRCREEHGQLYADVSRKVALDAFDRDLVKLLPEAECGPCPRRADCPGCWAPSKAEVFGRDDALLRALLRTLSGAVLDVGAGEARYLGELEPAAAEGALTYLGVEPEAGRVGLLGARHPWARYHCGTLDDLPPGEGPFDHVLVLRSWNHLPEPAAALRRMVELLRPGGTLLLVDNVPFGLLRSSQQADAAERGGGAFEHYRNDDAGDALAHCQGLPLEVLRRLDVGPTTSNQWLLHLSKQEISPR